MRNAPFGACEWVGGAHMIPLWSKRDESDSSLVKIHRGIVGIQLDEKQLNLGHLLAV